MFGRFVEEQTENILKATTAKVNIFMIQTFNDCTSEIENKLKSYLTKQVLFSLSTFHICAFCQYQKIITDTFSFKFVLEEYFKIQIIFTRLLKTQIKSADTFPMVVKAHAYKTCLLYMKPVLF